MAHLWAILLIYIWTIITSRRLAARLHVGQRTIVICHGTTLLALYPIGRSIVKLLVNKFSKKVQSRNRVRILNHFAAQQICPKGRKEKSNRQH
jgi:hypothetical protein